jgi:hypothetical protein
MQGSARMPALIENVPDCARGEMVGGITLKCSPQSLERFSNR